MGDVVSKVSHETKLIILNNLNVCFCRHVLNYLRSDRLAVPHGFREYDLLKVEADYYGLQSLVQEIDDTIMAKKRRNRRRPPRKKTSQSATELHRVQEKNGDLYISDADSDWFYD